MEPPKKKKGKKGKKGKKKKPEIPDKIVLISEVITVLQDLEPPINGEHFNKLNDMDGIRHKLWLFRNFECRWSFMGD